MSNIGHNGAPPAVGFDARSGTKMHYFQAEIVKFRDGIRTLKADQRGVYLSILLEIYDAMGPIPLDARRMSMATGLDSRLINRVIPELVELGKLYVADGWVHNSRAEKEIHDYVRNHVRLSDVAKEREAAKRELRSKDQSQVDELRQQLATALHDLREASALAKAQTTWDVSETSASAKPQLSETSQIANGEDRKKPSKNNDTETDDCQTFTTTRAREESRTKNLEDKERKDSPQPPGGGGDLLSAFETWWAAYPPSSRKVAKGECLALFRQAITGRRRGGKKGAQKILDHGLVTAESLIAAVQRFAATKPDPEYTPAPATWLNQGRWLDDAGKPVSQHPWWLDHNKVQQITPDQWRGSIRKHANGIWPISKLGPAPGDPKCVVPQLIKTEMRLDEIYDHNGMKRFGAPKVTWIEKHADDA